MCGFSKNALSEHTGLWQQAVSGGRSSHSRRWEPLAGPLPNSVRFSSATAVLACTPLWGQPLALADLHYLVTTQLGLMLLPLWLSEVTIYRVRNAVAGNMQGGRVL